jgi:hypothetical protein
MPLTVQSLTVTHGSGVGGCKILRQWRVSDLNFFRGKLRIFITFRGMEGILSKKFMPILHTSCI